MQNNDELIDLLENWQDLQHCGDYEFCEEIEKELKEKYNINMKKEWEKYLTKYELIMSTADLFKGEV